MPTSAPLPIQSCFPRRWLGIAGILCLLVGLPCPTAPAQLVQIGPGYVRAPFVRVETRADGGTIVRAPFVRVDAAPRRFAPAFGFPSPMNYDGSLPYVVERPRSSQELKLAQLLAAKRQLDGELLRLNAPASWFDFLRLSIPTENRPAAIPAPPKSEDPMTQLAEALARYDQAADDARYRLITDLAGFQSTHRRLREYCQVLQDANAVIEAPTVPDAGPFEVLPTPPPEPNAD